MLRLALRKRPVRPKRPRGGFGGRLGRFRHFRPLDGRADEELAKASKFGEIIVQGGVTSAILNAVVAEKLPGPGTVFLNVNWNFIAPVRPGDRITGEVRVTGAREDKPICELDTRVLLEDGTVVLDGKVVCYTMPLE